MWSRWFKNFLCSSFGVQRILGSQIIVRSIVNVDWVNWVESKAVITSKKARFQDNLVSFLKKIVAASHASHFFGAICYHPTGTNRGFAVNLFKVVQIDSWEINWNIFIIARLFVCDKCPEVERDQVSSSAKFKSKLCKNKSAFNFSASSVDSARCFAYE